MKIKLKKPNEWGHYIDQESLEIREVVGEIPNNSLVIIRMREFRSELSRNVVLTRYSNISKNMLVHLNKRDFTKKLAKQCAQYMLSKNKIPPKVSFAKKIVENKPVELIFSFSSNILFEMKITEELLEGKKPDEFFNKLIESSDKDYFNIKREKRWKIEYAPNGRSLCKKCKRQIKEKEVRLGEHQVIENQIVQQFYHYRCVDWSKMKENLIHGISELIEVDQKQIRKKMK